MRYESLEKIYYTRSQEHEKIYIERFNSLAARHFDFPIQEVGRQKAYPAFFCYTEEFARLTDEIYRKHEELLQALRAVPPLVLEQFILGSLVDEVRATSDIEGVHSTRREIKEVVIGSAHSERFSSIVGKYQSLLDDTQMKFQTCDDVRTFYDEFAHKEIAAANPAHALDGKIFRADSVEITSPTGKILHHGAYPEAKIIELLNVALKTLNDTEVPLLVRVAVFHCMFEYVHPFYDGNGRTARFIVSYFLAGRFGKLVALRLSVLIKRNRKKYYELFRQADSERNCGDLTPFVIGFTEIVSATFDDIISTLNAKILQLIKFQQRLSEIIDGDKLTRQIYTALLQSSTFFGGGISMQRLMDLTGKSRNTIKARLAIMPEGHILPLKGLGRLMFFRLNTAIFENS